MTNNPSEMSNEDLERDMESRNAADNNKPGLPGNTEDDELDSEVPVEKSMDMGVDFPVDKEQDLDDLVHEQAKVKGTGTIPDPEEIKFRESQ
jgi:hypothetical protein